jgi:hypothetical protein
VLGGPTDQHEIFSSRRSLTAAIRLVGGLQRVSETFVTDYRATNRPVDLAACRALLSKSFIGLYRGYTRGTFWAKDLDPAHAWLRWATHMVQWHRRFRGDSADNPLHFDPATDRSYWFAAP